MNRLDNAIVTARHIAKATSKGNLDGVSRLAQFVCSSSTTDPWTIFEACQKQRILGLKAQEESSDAEQQR